MNETTLTSELFLKLENWKIGGGKSDRAMAACSMQYGMVTILTYP